MVCKNICERHRAIKPLHGGRYKAGQKKCQVCDIFIWWEGIWCPCCGYKLRVKTRGRKTNAKGKPIVVEHRY